MATMPEAEDFTYTLRIASCRLDKNGVPIRNGWKMEDSYNATKGSTVSTMRKPEDFTPAEVQGRQAEYPGMTEAQARISLERQQVYGDAFENHAGIAATWVGELQGWGQHISEGRPLPPDVVARMMALLKLNRCRLDYHEDNYIDHAVYALFAQAWQKRRVASGGPMPLANPCRKVT